MKNKSSRIQSMLVLILGTVVLIGFSIGCSKVNDYGSGSGGNPPANEVWLQGSQFKPATLTVAVNTTVKWTNKDSYNHTVTSDSTMFNSGNMGGAATFSYQFTKKGSYKYHCQVHPMMTGTIIVQ